jgi:hypothetical protein
MMESNPDSSYRSYIPSTIVLFIIGWGSVAYAITMLTPTVWARWLLFFGGAMGLTSLALPVTWFLNLRFPSHSPAGAGVIVRQALWFGVYGALLTWLQQARLVTLWTALGLAAGLVAIEFLVRMRENARWQPAPRSSPNPAQKPPADVDRTEE